MLFKITPELSLQHHSSVPEKSEAWPKEAGILTQDTPHSSKYIHLEFLLL